MSQVFLLAAYVIRSALRAQGITIRVIEPVGDGVKAVIFR